jgi:pyruvate,water dikinase
MADQVRAVPGLAAVLATGTPAAIRGALHERPDVARSFAAYLDEFGERCLEELKLETLTLADEPLQLYRAVGRLAGAPARLPNAAGVAAPHAAPRALAEARVDAALGRRGPRARLFGWVLREARARVRDRENLRFERTRLFGRVRRVFVELGRRYAAAGLLADPRDVFYLDLDEVLGAVDATVSCDDLAGLAATRRAAFAGYAAGPAPADRFLTHGLVLAGHSYTAPAAVTDAAAVAVAADGDDARRQGIGCYPGEVTGRVRVVRDPRTAELEPARSSSPSAPTPGG